MIPMPEKFTLNKRDSPSRIKKIARSNVPSLRVILIMTSYGNKNLLPMKGIGENYIGKIPSTGSTKLKSLINPFCDK